MLFIKTKMIKDRLDFPVVRFLIKLFQTYNNNLMTECQAIFNFFLPSELLQKKTSKICQHLANCPEIVRHLTAHLQLFICFLYTLLIYSTRVVYFVVYCCLLLLPLVVKWRLSIQITNAELCMQVQQQQHYMNRIRKTQPYVLRLSQLPST